MTWQLPIKHCRKAQESLCRAPCSSTIWVSSETHLGCPRMNWHSCPGSHWTVAQASSRETHRAQHAPSAKNATSPGKQTGAAHKIPAHGSERHLGQHSPSGIWRLSPMKPHSGGSGHSTVEQSWTWHSEQHWPSGVTLTSPGLQSRSAGHSLSLQGSKSQPPNLELPPWIAAPGRVKGNVCNCSYVQQTT